MTLEERFAEARACTLCAANLPLGPRPILRGRQGSRILIIGQAPGTKVHASGVPWDDPSGVRLRRWMGLSPEEFYNESLVAIVPMGFCYPGKGKSGDLPPRPECAPKWHPLLLPLFTEVRLTILVGSYALDRYLPDYSGALGAHVLRWREYAKGGLFPLVHPSPRNQLWLSKNPWFEAELVPDLRDAVSAAR